MALRAATRASERARSCRSTVTTMTAITAVMARATAVMAISKVSIFLSQFEFDGDFDHHVHRRAETPGRREPPLFYRVNGALIESGAEPAQEAHVAHCAVGADDDFEFDVA